MQLKKNVLLYISKGKTLRVNTVQDETNKELLKEVETLSNKLTALQAEIKNIIMGDSHGSRHRWNSCKTKGVFECNHCFKCGSVEDISRHCRKRQLDWIASVRLEAIKDTDKHIIVRKSL